MPVFHLHTIDTLEYAFGEGYQQCIKTNYNEKNTTLAEVENTCAREIYLTQLKKLDAIIEKIKSSDSFTDFQKKNIRYQNEDFLKFVEQYGQANADAFLRTNPYHKYGSMIDLINLKMKHLLIILNTH